MSLPVVFRPPARKELDEAIDWYERKRVGLGAEFGNRVREVLARISATPELHGVVYKDIRCALVHRFPYAVFYRVKWNRVRVIAVFHCKRDPRIWQRRS